MEWEQGIESEASVGVYVFADVFVHTPERCRSTPRCWVCRCRYRCSSTGKCKCCMPATQAHMVSIALPTLSPPNLHFRRDLLLLLFFPHIPPTEIERVERVVGEGVKREGNVPKSCNRARRAKSSEHVKRVTMWCNSLGRGGGKNVPLPPVPLLLLLLPPPRRGRPQRASSR